MSDNVYLPVPGYLQGHIRILFTTRFFYFVLSTVLSLMGDFSVFILFAVHTVWFCVFSQFAPPEQLFSPNQFSLQTHLDTHEISAHLSGFVAFDIYLFLWYGWDKCYWHVPCLHVYAFTKTFQEIKCDVRSQTGKSFLMFSFLLIIILFLKIWG